MHINQRTRLLLFVKKRWAPFLISAAMIALLLLILGYTIYFLYYRNITDLSQSEDTQDVSNIKKESDSYQKDHTPDENKELEIDNLSFESKTEDNKEYKIHAKKAFKIEGGNYIMREVMASIILEEGILDIDAPSGIYEEKGANLILSDNILGKYKGYDFKTNSLMVNIEDQTLKSDSKVEIDGEKISIRADKLKSTKDNLIIFEGNVKTVFHPN
ncbi:MAG: LPS export ABC transporter periplasmic protein LptC [Rickettsiaceae bacterium]|nr:LPS export ABC transporter periplasmic protein LptC [Rickettsiaceae bacterium]